MKPKPTRFKFFNGPYVGTIQQGHLVKRTKGEDWRLQLSDGTLIDLEFGIRMGTCWRDVKVASTSAKEVVFRPLYRFGFRGKKFSVTTESLT